jgi:hypothetical protein
MPEISRMLAIFQFCKHRLMVKSLRIISARRLFPLLGLLVLFALLANTSSVSAQSAQPSLSSFTFESARVPQSPIETTIAEDKKSPLLAALLSALVPGLGEAYTGRFDAGRYLSGSEVVLWGGYAGLTVYTSDFQNDMESNAISSAGASSARRGDGDYFAHVGQYQSSDIFNEEMLREGKPDQLISNGQGWRWSTKEEEKTFDALRIRVQTLDNDRQFMLAAIVVNHLISAIDAFIVTRKYNKALLEKPQDHGSNLIFGPRMGALTDPKGASLFLHYTF